MQHKRRSSTAIGSTTITRRRAVWLGVMMAVGLLGQTAKASQLRPEQVPPISVRGRVLKVNGQSPEGKAFTLRFASDEKSASWTGGGWSDWVPLERSAIEKLLKDYPATYIDKWPVVPRLSFGGIEVPTQVEAELKLDETGAVVKCEANLVGPTLGLILWRDEAGKPNVNSMTGYNRRYWKTIGLDPSAKPLTPKHFPVVDRYIAGDHDQDGLKEALTEMNRAGFSGLMLEPSERTRMLALEVGQRRTAGAVYNPPGYAFDHTIASDEEITKWAKQQAAPFKAPGYAPQDMAMYAMSDEPGWYYPDTFTALVKNPTALARFRKYIADQGLQPSDLGHGTWETVLPIGRSKAVDLPSKRLYYWTMRFFPWDSSRHFAKSTKALEAEFYPGMPIFTNWNNFTGRVYVPGPIFHNQHKQDPDAAMAAHDWFEFGRMRGGTMLWTEDWFADSQAPQWSFYMARLRSAARLGNIECGGYVIPRTAGQREFGIDQKIMSVVGHGGKAVKYFVFGPEYCFPSNCYSENSHVMKGMARAHGMIAKAEEVLWPGKAPRAQVAILAPRSSFIWDDNGGVGKTPIEDATNMFPTGRTIDYAAETYGIYTALQYANIPCDFVDEDGLTDGELKHYQVIFVTEPNLPPEGCTAIADWVRGGGTLVKTSGAMQRDRYDEPLPPTALAGFLPEKPRKPMLVPELSAFSVVAQGTGAAGEFSAVAVRGEFTDKVDEFELPGKFADGSPAIVRQPLGKGHVIHFAFLPGISFVKSARETKDHLPVGFSPSLRDYIALAVRDARIQPPVQADADYVETPLLLSAAGAAITVLNWSGEPIERLGMSVRLPFVPTRVESVQKGSLEFRHEAGVVRLAIPLDAVDVIMLRP